MLAPDRDITVHVDGIPRRPRLSIDVPNLLPWSRLDDLAAPRSKGDSRDLVQAPVRASMQHGEQLFQCNLAFPHDHKISACVEILIDVSGRLRATDNRSPTGIFSAAQNFDYVGTGHQVCVDAKH